MSGRHRRLKLLILAVTASVLAAGLVQARSPLHWPWAHHQQETPQVPPQEPPPPVTPETPAIYPPEPPPPGSEPPSESASAPPKSEAPESARVKSVPPPPAAEPQSQVRQRHGGAIIQGLDKITAETMRFEVRVGHPVRYKGLVFTVRECETTGADEPMADSMAFVEVRDEPRSAGGEQTSHEVFAGWMFASSPGLRPLQHPVYDAWLIACKA